MLSLTSGIPQSAANPLLDFIDQGPELAEQHRRQMEDWRFRQIQTVDRAALDPDAFYADKKLDIPGLDPAALRTATTVRSYLTLANDGRPVTGDLYPEVLRQKIAAERFGGRGADSDESFFAEIRNEAQTRKDAAALAAEIQTAATTGALLRETSEAGIDSQSFQLWREEARKKPGYQPGLDFAYREAWTETQTAVRENVEPYLGPLKQVWQSMQAGGADWYGAWEQVPPENRDAFMASLAIMARALPAEQQPTFWGNLAKQATRDIQGQAINIMEGIGTALDTGSPLNDYDPFAEQAAATENRSRKNFIADIERIRNETYDPVKVLNPDSSILRTLERGSYSAPGAIATSVAALVPYVGPVATYYHMEESAYRDMRRTLLDGGMSDADASATAEGLAPLIAVPQAALERIGAGALVGKLPGLEKVLAATANRITSTAGRYAARTGAIAGFETAIENTQDLIPNLLQDAASALEKDVPGVVWRNGKDGFLDGYWEKTATTAVAILPLALIGGAGGISADARAKAFAQAPDLHLRVLGIPAEGVARIREAQKQGNYQAQQAIEAEITAETFAPRGEDAMDATQELAENLQAEKEAVAAATQSGAMPAFYRSADGWSVRDGESGAEIGTATSADGALRLAIAHSAAIEEENADQIASLASLLESGDVVAGFNKDTGITETDFRPGQTVTTSQQSALSEADDLRIRGQIEARERLGGGDGGTARLVLGNSATETRQKVRRTVNKINEYGSVLTVFHEETHGFYREALATGRLTRDETLAAIRSLETVLAGKTTKDGQQLRFLPDGEVTDLQLDEAVSELMEAEILRTRKANQGSSRANQGSSNPNQGSSRQLPPGLVTRNLTAMARLAPGAAQKLRDFIAAVRAFWGLTFQRAAAIKSAIREGKLDEAQLDTFKAKLFGLEDQTDLEQAARDTEARILDGSEQAAELDGDPFSLGPSRGKPVAEVIFPEPITGPSGAKLTSYVWQSKLAERANEEGEMKLRRVSDWEQAVASAETGKDVVHQFRVETADGVKIVSIESALSLLGLTPEQAKPLKSLASALKTYGKQRIKVQTLEGMVAQYEADQSEVDALPVPPITSKPHSVDYGPMAGKPALIYDIDGVQSFPDWNDKGPDRAYLTQQWRQREMKRKGWQKDPTQDLTEARKQLRRTEKKIEQQAAEQAAFSLGPAALADLLGKDAVSRIKDPVRRVQAMSRVAREMEAARLQFERLELIAGSKRLKKSLAREAAIRTALRREELENEAWARHWQVLSDDDLVKIKSQPAHKLLSDPGNPLRGRIQSRTAAIAKNPDLYTFKDPAEYNGSEAVTRSVFGGTLTPDQAVEALVEEGLLPPGSKPDAMWQLLQAEALSVTNRKRDLEIAKQELREARTQATDETNVWLREQGVIQETTFGDKQEILRTLGILDGILSAVPAEIRGKVGGYTQLARITTNEAKLAFLKDRLARIDTELEKYLRDQFDREFRALLDKAKPEKDEAGKKPRGKITPTIHALFRAVEDAMTMTGAEVEAEAARLESLANSGDYTAEEENHLNLTAGMILLAGNWAKADAAQREAAVIQGTKLFEAGYMARKIELAKQRERRAKTADTFQTATKATGDDQIRRDTARKQDTRRGAVSAVKANLLSFEGVLQEAFGLDSPEVEQFVTWERHAANAKQDALQHKYDLLDDLLATMAGGKFKGEQLRAKLQDPDAVTWTDWKGRKQSVSELQAVHMTMMYRQEDGRRHMEGHLDEVGKPIGDWHYRPEDMAAIEDQLSDNAKAIRVHLSETYAAEWERINAVFEQNEGVSLPRHKLYAPVTVDPANAQANQMLDPTTGTVASPSFTPGSLRNRSQTAIAKPNFDADAIQVYLGHVRQMEHYIAYSTFAREMMAVTNRREVRDAIKETAGPELQKVLASWLDYFATGAVMDKSTMFRINRILSAVINRFSAATLVGRVGVLAIQSTQLLAAWSYMPTGAYLSRLARLMSGRLDWSGALKSDYIQRRKAQMPATIQQLMEGLRSAKPSRLIYTQRKMGETIAGADALFTAGTFAITYDYHLSRAKKQGMTGQQATDYALQQAEAATDRVAQPVRPGTRSIFEVSLTNPAARMIWNFASDARQKFAIGVFQHADRTPMEKARALGVVWLAGGIVSTIIRSAMRDARDDGEDDEIFDERNWDPARLGLQSLAGPLNGIPYIGDTIEAAIFAAAGEYMPSSGTPLDNTTKAIPAVKRLITGDVDGMEQALKDAEAILSAGALADERLSAAASLSHLVRDLFGIVQNVTE